MYFLRAMHITTAAKLITITQNEVEPRNAKINFTVMLANGVSASIRSAITIVNKVPMNAHTPYFFHSFAATYELV